MPASVGMSAALCCKADKLLRNEDEQDEYSITFRRLGETSVAAVQ